MTNWKPIKDAPRDGTEIVATKGYGYCHIVVSWKTYLWDTGPYGYGKSFSDEDFNFYMAIPKTPEKDKRVCVECNHGHKTYRTDNPINVHTHSRSFCKKCDRDTLFLEPTKNNQPENFKEFYPDEPQFTNNLSDNLHFLNQKINALAEYVDLKLNNRSE